MSSLSRRKFLQKSATALAVGSIWNQLEAETLTNAALKNALLPPAQATTDEDFWEMVRQSFTTSPNVINLNNGGVSPQPKPVQEAHMRYYQYCNEAPSYYMWRVLDAGREPLREKLASLSGCSPEEIAINRNSTEGLNSIIFGLNLKAGDEVVLTKQDYPNMINAWKQREKRDGIKLVWLDFNLPIENDETIVEAYANAFTKKTRIAHVTHIINWVGQILPVAKIAKIAHEKGIEVLCDGAHSFAHIDYKIPELNCDYFATSLHKWLCAPFGSGLMYIRKEKIKNVWALLSNDKPDGDDIRKFESLGTRSMASEMAIGAAVDYHLLIGSQRKEERLRYLKNYWCNKVANLPNVKLNTSLKNAYSCAIANFSINGLTPAEIDTQLWDKYKIHAVAIVWHNISGVRITPHVYTTPRDLDKLATAITNIAEQAGKKG